MEIWKGRNGTRTRDCPKEVSNNNKIVLDKHSANTIMDVLYVPLIKAFIFKELRDFIIRYVHNFKLLYVKLYTGAEPFKG